MFKSGKLGIFGYARISSKSVFAQQFPIPADVCFPERRYRPGTELVAADVNWCRSFLAVDVLGDFLSSGIGFAHGGAVESRPPDAVGDVLQL
jgi:hypothetical protein